MRYGVMALMLAAVMLAGCGGSESKGGSGTAEDALRRGIEYQNARQFGKEWELLPPVQQAFIAQERWIECRTKTPAVTYSDIKVLESRPEPFTITGTDMKADSTAITFQVQARAGTLAETQKTTAHLVLIDGRWRIPSNKGDDYKAGRCPN